MEFWLWVCDSRPSIARGWAARAAWTWHERYQIFHPVIATGGISFGLVTGEMSVPPELYEFLIEH